MFILYYNTRMFEDITQKLKSAKIIPVVKIEDAQKAVLLSKALLDGGITAVEITFRTTNGEAGFAKIKECIALIKKEVPSILVGAGTVINEALAEMAIKAGAGFIVSPGFNPKTIDYCLSQNVAIYPGINNPSQVELALAKNLNVLKFFPSEISGGVPMLKALSGPFPTVSFIATGGINQKNARAYLQCKNVAAIGGTWMAAEEFIQNGEWDKITQLSKLALKAIDEPSLSRVKENTRIASSVGDRGMSEEEKMLEGLLYDPTDKKLETQRIKAHALCQDYNLSRDTESQKRNAILKDLLGEAPEALTLQGPIQFDYGINTHFGSTCYANFNFTVLDTCKVSIGNNVYFGPNCSLVTPMHPLLPKDRNIRKRENGELFDYEYGKPITIKDNCWLASNVTVCGGVTIGEGSVIGAGSVVTKDIPPNSLAAGVPCKVIRPLTEEDAMVYREIHKVC